MRTTKRLCAMALSACLGIACLSGCGQQQTDSGSGKPLELEVWETQGTDCVAKELKDNLVRDWLEQKTNVKVVNLYGNDGGSWDAKLSKLVAGDNLPDIVHCGAWQGPAHFAKLNQLSEVWELTPEMIQEYAPEVWKRTPERFWEKMKVDGKLFGIPYGAEPSKEVLPEMSEEELSLVYDLKVTPYNDVTYHPGQTLWIRDDILKQFYPEAKTYEELVSLLEERNEPIGDELMDVPILSTEQYIQFMYDIQKLGLTEEGKKVYPFGYTGADNWCALHWLGGDMFGYKGHSYTGTWNQVKQKIEVPLVGAMVRQAAKTQNQMLLDRVIDPESLAQTSNVLKEKVLNGQYAIIPLTAVDDPATINNQLKASGKTFQYRPFITQVSRPEGYGAFQEEQMWIESMAVTKNLTEDELHQVLRWINVQYTDEYEEIKNWGTKEAGLYQETSDGKREFTDPRFAEYYLEGDSNALQPEETKGLQGPPGYTEGGLFAVYPTKTSRWTPEILLRYKHYLPNGYSGFKFKADSPHVTGVPTYPPCQVWSSVYADIPEVVTFWAEREQWESQFKLALAAPSQEEFDQKWDKAIEELNKIVDVKTMEDKMTEIAKPLADELAQ